MATIKVRDTTAYVIVDSPPASNVRDVTAYAITRDPYVAQVRHIPLLVLRNDPRGQTFRSANLGVMRRFRKPDFSVDVFDQLFAALKSDFPKVPFTAAAQLIWSNPRASSGVILNSLVDIAAASGNGYSGKYTLQYDRYRLSHAFAGKDVSTFTASADGTVVSTLPQINTQFGLNLKAIDVVDGPVRAGHGVTLTSAATSFWFIPGESMQLGAGDAPSLSSAFVTTKLSGFDPA